MRINIPLHRPCVRLFRLTMLYVLALLLVAGKAQAQQQTITIPLNNDQDREYPSPLGCQPAYNKTQVVYTSSELGGAPGVISSVAFYVTSLNNPMSSTPVVISMKNSSATSLISTIFQEAKTGTTTVFSGMVTNTQLIPNTWVVIPLSSPFSYAGQSLELLIECDPGIPDMEEYNAKRFRWSDYNLANVSQQWTEYTTAPGPNSLGRINSYRPNIKLALNPAIAMSYVSSTTTQPRAITSAGKTKQLVAGIQVEMVGSTNPMALTDIDLSRMGSSAQLNAINNVKVYYTGINASFDTTILFGAFATSPAGSFTISGNRTLSTGTNYLWVTYDIDPTVALGDSVDIICSQLTIDGTLNIPSVTSPAGNILIGRTYTFDTTTNQHFATSATNTLTNQWQRGTPTQGPSKAFNGTSCWGTDLTNGIGPGANSSLVTPSYSITGPEVLINYKQWYHMLSAYATTSTFEFNINNSGWTTLNSLFNWNYEITSNNWEDVFYAIPASVGDEIQFRWHFVSDPNNSDIRGEGWFIDNFCVAGITPIPQLYQVSFASDLGATTLANSDNNQVIRVAVAVKGTENLLNVTSVNFNTNGTTAGVGFLKNAKLFYTESRDVFDTTHLFGLTPSPNGAFTINGNQSLVNGLNFFWLTYDLSAAIQPGDTIDASCTQLTINSLTYIPFNPSPGGYKVVGRLFNFDATGGTELFTGKALNAKEPEWQKGVPSIGPATAYSGTRCWGTNLISGYSQNSSYALNSPQFVATAASVAVNYQQWYKLTSAYNISATFQYMVNHSNSWNTVNSLPSNMNWVNSSNQWVPAVAYIPTSIGDTIEFRWVFTTYSGVDPDAGWYIDDFVVCGANTFNQSLKNNTITSVPGIAGAGETNIAITRIELEITGNENPLKAQSFTLDLANTLPATGLVTAAKLFYTGTKDEFNTQTQFGRTVVNPTGLFTLNDSMTLQTGTNYFWLAYNIATSAQGGDTLNSSCTQVKINNVLYPFSVATPAEAVTVGRLYTFDVAGTQGFETAKLGTNPNKWQKGTPTNVGPTSTPSGSQCWATVIDGNITANSDYALKTPAYIAQSTTIQTSYMQWFQITTAYDVDAKFEYQVNNGGWNTLSILDKSTYAISTNNKWIQALSQINVSVGDTVQFQWRFTTQSWVNEAPGWYIDNFKVTGVGNLNQTIVTSIFDKYNQILLKGKTNQAILQVYIETLGTDNIQSVTSFDLNTLTSVWGVIDSAKLYYTGASPDFDTRTRFGQGYAAPAGSYTITGNQTLLPGGNYFWLTYDINANALPGDSLAATCTSFMANMNSNTPSPMSLAGQLFVGELYNFDTTNNQLFEVTQLGTNGSSQMWQRGTPSNVGPAAAYSGLSCWGTNLSGNYHSTSNYALLSVPFIVQSTQVLVGYKQWYELLAAYNIYAQFQYMVNSSNVWLTLDELNRDDIVNSNNKWEDVLKQPFVTVGDTIQFRWRFYVNAPSSPSAAGWYIDNFTISGIRPFSQSFTKVEVEQLVNATAANTPNLAILRIPVTITGSQNPLEATTIRFNTNGSSGTAGLIAKAKMYYTGLSSTFDMSRQYGAAVTTPNGSFSFTDKLILPAGVNYFWLTYDVGSAALSGDVLDAEFEKITLSTIDYFATTPAPAGNIMVGELYTFEAPYAQNFTTAAVSGTKNEWQRGVPVKGPSATYSGSQCWGTNITTGQYTNNANYALTTARYVATSSTISTSYKQWYEIGAAWDVVAEFQYSVNSGSWNSLNTLNTSGDLITSDNKWENVANQIAVAIGDTVRFRWHFVSGMWGTPAAGWFIDNFIVTAIQKIDAYAPSISYTPLSNIGSVTNRVLTGFASINDESGIQSAPGSGPRIYFKKSSESDVFGNYPSANIKAFNGWKYVEASNLTSPFSFTLNYALLTSAPVLNDTIEYFVVAADASATPNIASLPSTNFTALSVNDIFTSPSDKNSFVIIQSPLNGIYTIGAGQPFTTITSAANALNRRGVSGPVTLLLADSIYNTSRGEVFPVTFNEIPGASNVNTITIKPASGKNVTITSPNAAFKFDDADYITLNGSNGSANTRNLTLLGTGTTAVVWIGSGVNGAHHNTVTNLDIKGNNLTKFGVYAGTSEFTSVTSGSSAPNSYNTIERNSIGAVNIGVAFVGNTLIGADIGNRVYQNQIGDAAGSISGVGVFVQKQISDSIIGNTLNNIYAPIKGIDVNSAVAGIYAYQIKQTVISNNTVTDYIADCPSGALLGGIIVNGSGYSTTNNIISNNVVADGHATNANVYSFSGIDIGEGYGDKVYYNTVSLTGDLIKTSGTVTAFHNGSSLGIDIRNNIFSINGTSASSATFFAHDSYLNYVGSTLDYNLLSCNAKGSAVARIARGNNTLAAWQKQTGKETNSKTAWVSFVSATDLHLAGTSIGDTANLKGTAIAGLNTDIDGDTRNTAFPYMGADENTSHPLPVKLIAFTATLAQNDVLLQWNTASEVNNKGFYVERLTADKTWERISYIPAASVKNTYNNYRFVDSDAFGKTDETVLYYRLKQIDFDGASTYSAIVSVTANHPTAAAVNVFPNPFQTSMAINLSTDAANEATVYAYDIMGKKVFTQAYSLQKGTNTLNIEQANLWHNGIYFVIVETGAERKTIKVIKN